MQGCVDCRLDSAEHGSLVIVLRPDDYKDSMTFLSTRDIARII